MHARKQFVRMHPDTAVTSTAVSGRDGAFSGNATAEGVPMDLSKAFASGRDGAFSGNATAEGVPMYL